MTYAPTVDLYQVRFTYSQSGLNHVFQSWLMPYIFTTDPTGSWDDYALDVLTGSLTASAWLSNFTDVYMGMFPDSTEAVSAELWAYEANSLDAHFLAATSVSQAGTLAGTVVLASQMIFSARTTTGSTKKFTAEEVTSTPGNPTPWDASDSTAYVAFRTFVLGDDGKAFRDRKGGYVVATTYRFPGQNEHTFKRRYRNVT